MDKIKSGRNAVFLAMIFSVLAIVMGTFYSDVFKLRLDLELYFFVIDVILLAIGAVGLQFKNKYIALSIKAYFLISRVAFYYLSGVLGVVSIIINIYILYCLFNAIKSILKMRVNVTQNI